MGPKPTKQLHPQETPNSARRQLGQRSQIAFAAVPATRSCAGPREQRLKLSSEDILHGAFLYRSMFHANRLGILLSNFLVGSTPDLLLENDATVLEAIYLRRSCAESLSSRPLEGAKTVLRQIFFLAEPIHYTQSPQSVRFEALVFAPRHIESGHAQNQQRARF